MSEPPSSASSRLGYIPPAFFPANVSTCPHLYWRLVIWASGDPGPDPYRDQERERLLSFAAQQVRLARAQSALLPNL